jgi:hypothetical protein
MKTITPATDPPMITPESVALNDDVLLLIAVLFGERVVNVNVEDEPVMCYSFVSFVIYK